jgi:predicted outer membrane repeat protein
MKSLLGRWRRTMRLFKNLFFTIFFVLVLIAGMQNASAATFTVANTNDSGAGSLREAILSANDGDTILFDSSLNDVTITLLSQLNLDKSLIIDGGLNDITISGNGKYRIFRATSLLSTITLKDLTLDRGYSGPADYGSALYCNGNANLINCTFSNNFGDCGGAVAIFGNANITNCTFINNVAQDSGGAVYCMGGGAKTITNCTFSGNVSHRGSAIYSNTILNITNCTFINNSTYSGAVIYFYDSYPIISNCIMWNNGVSSSSNIIEFIPTVFNSIIEGYSGPGSIDVNPMIGALGDYGGTVQTVPLLPGSPAIGGGTLMGAPTTDARGVQRVGSNDIGAFQSSGFNLGFLTGTPQSAIINTDFGIPLELTMTANNNIEPVAGGKVIFSAPVSGASCALSTSASAIGSGGKVSVVATANGIVGGPYKVTAYANGVSSVEFSLTNTDAIKTVTVSAIQGVVLPVKNQVPVNSIAETDQYSGTVTWTPSDNQFADGKEYTATIMLTPKTGYTFSGVTENFFTVAGATTINDADSGIVTAVFPATESEGSTSHGSDDSFIISVKESAIVKYGAKFSIPEGAVKSNTTGHVILFGNGYFKDPYNRKIIGSIFKFVKTSSGDFLKPMTVTMPIKISETDIHNFNLYVLHYDESLNKWTELDNVVVDEKNGTIRGETKTTGFFAVAVSEKNEDPSLEYELTDIAGHWAELNIRYLIEMKAIEGYPDNSFRPNNNITRAEFVVCLVKSFGLEGTSSKTFDDMAGHWSKNYIDTAMANEIIKGYDEFKFGPDDFITREQMAAMIVRAAKSVLKSGELSFTDKYDIDEQANIFIYTAISNNFMKGYPDNTFRPSGNATRAEAVTVIYNVLKK